MYYHIKFMLGENGESKPDLTEEQLKVKYIEPYLSGVEFTINGRVLSSKEIKRVNVYRSLEPIEEMKEDTFLGDLKIHFLLIDISTV